MPVLKEEDLLGSENVILYHAAEYAGPWLKKVAEVIQEMELPVDIAEEQASSGLIKALTGGARNVLVVNPKSKALNRYRWLMYAFPIGKNVTLGYYLIGEGTGFGRSAGVRIPILHNADIFDNVDIRALDQSIIEACVIARVAIQKRQGDAYKVLSQVSRMFGTGS